MSLRADVRLLYYYYIIIFILQFPRIIICIFLRIIICIFLGLCSLAYIRPPLILVIYSF